MPSSSETEFLDTKQVRIAPEELVVSAERRLILVTAFVDFKKRANFWRDVGVTAKRGVEVMLYVRDDENNLRKAEEERSFFDYPHLDAFRVPNLHAKIYFNERMAVVGSVNLVAASFEQSIEFGVRVPIGHSLYESSQRFGEDHVHPFSEPLFGPRSTASPSSKAPAERRRYSDRDACYRCGRTGHWGSECYARTDIDGNKLDDDDDNRY